MAEVEEEEFVEEKEEELDEESIEKVVVGVDEAFAKPKPSTNFSSTLRFDFRYSEENKESSLPQGISAFKSIQPFSLPPPPPTSAAQQLAELLSGTFPWQCSECTLFNEPGIKSCGACGASPPPPSISFPDLASLAPAQDSSVEHPSESSSSVAESQPHGDEADKLKGKEDSVVSEKASSADDLYSIVQMKDCASFLSLHQLTGLRCDTSTLANESPFFENWTISMDILIPQLPTNEPLPLLSCFHDPTRTRSTKEAVVYPNGSVGIFDVISDVSFSYF